MARTPLSTNQYPGDDGGYALSTTPTAAGWVASDFTNGNVISDPSEVIILCATHVAATRRVRLTCTQKGVTVTKDYTVNTQALFGFLVLLTLDTQFWGQHGSVDQGKIYLDFPDSAANTEVYVCVIRRFRRS